MFLGIILYIFCILYINPNWTGWGKSWPCWQWPQTARKLIKYLFFKNTYFCRNVFRIILNFWHDLKKLGFDVHFDVCIFIRSPAEAPSCLPPLLPPSFTIFIDHLREKSCRAVVRSPARRQSGYWSVSSPGPRRVRLMAGSQSGPISGSF
jgi:hypothetical protein